MKNDSSKNGPKAFYITTTLPYVNADPHIGFAMEIVHADIIARWKKLLGYDVFFNTGTDEHGQKVFLAAQKENTDTQAYTDKFADKFKELGPLLGLTPDLHFIRTTDKKHREAAQEFWQRCVQKGDIYKKNYKIKYCVGCELEKMDSELVLGRCAIHPDRELEIREEENYFFAFSKYQKPLLDFYTKQPDFVLPDFRFNEIKKFLEMGAEDFSVSRLKEKMPWGVPVPGDPAHVMYVWFDALVNYISTLGWPEDDKTFSKFWVNGTPVQFAGKDQVRQQAAMWQAMLLSAGLPLSRHIVIHGFINFGGQKMSKSLGNVVSPKDVVEAYGTEALRYFVAGRFNQFEDTDITMELLKETYNSHLANGLGNLVSRIMKMAETHLSKAPALSDQAFPEDYATALEHFEIQKAVEIVWQHISALDAKIQISEPFKLVKTDKEKAIGIISELVAELYLIGRLLEPVLPATSEKIMQLIKANKSPTQPLFLRKE
jgi:methionyl-tRNA synthetase